MVVAVELLDVTEDVVVFTAVVMLVVEILPFIVLRNTPKPTMRIITIATRLTTPRETALVAFANRVEK